MNGEYTAKEQSNHSFKQKTKHWILIIRHWLFRDYFSKTNNGIKDLIFQKQILKIDNQMQYKCIKGGYRILLFKYLI